MNGRLSARARTEGGKMLGKLFVSRVSACLFLLSFSSSQLITSGPHRRELFHQTRKLFVTTAMWCLLSG
jgi:hypothetical protein